MSVGSKVRFYREAKNYSQEDLATLLDVAQTTISSIESDKSTPSAVLLNRIAEELEVDINDLLEDVKTVNNFKDNGNVFGVGSNNSITVNMLSEKLIEQYEERINALKQQIELLKSKQ